MCNLVALVVALISFQRHQLLWRVPTASCRTAHSSSINGHTPGPVRGRYFVQHTAVGNARRGKAKISPPRLDLKLSQGSTAIQRFC